MKPLLDLPVSVSETLIQSQKVNTCKVFYGIRCNVRIIITSSKARSTSQWIADGSARRHDFEMATRCYQLFPVCHHLSR